MNTASLTHRMEVPASYQLLLPPLPPRKYLGLSQPVRESPVMPEDLAARAVIITSELWEMLERVEAVPHGGIND